MKKNSKIEKIETENQENKRRIEKFLTNLIKLKIEESKNFQKINKIYTKLICLNRKIEAIIRWKKNKKISKLTKN